MKGYTIENSIDLLEKDVKALKEGGGGGGGASTWNQLRNKPFNALGDELYNLDGDLTVNTISADKIALPDSSEHSWDYLTQAIEALAEDVNHFSDDISELEARGGYSMTDEVLIGTWIDGNPIYRAVFSVTSQTPLPSNTWVYLNYVPKGNIIAILRAFALDQAGAHFMLNSNIGTDYIGVNNLRPSQTNLAPGSRFIFEYVRNVG